MNTELDVLDVVESNSSKNAKLEHLTKSNSTALADLLNAALNFHRKFHIKKFEEHHDKPPQNISSHSQFMGILTQLEKRVFVGAAAQQLVSEFLLGCTEQQRKWYSRVLRKDLSAGFSINTANKAGFNIPKFDVMLAKDGLKCKSLEKVVSQGVMVSAKLDGYRCIAVCNDGNISLYSRNGKQYSNFPELERELSAKSQGVSFVLDGEIMSNDFSKMQQSAFASKRGTTVGDIKFYVFGYIDYDEWQTQNFKMKTSERILRLLQLDVASDIVNVVPHQFTKSVDELMAMQMQYEEDGYEGAMLLPNVPYYLGRKSNKLMKLKTMESQDCKIIAVNQGGGKYSDTFGSFTVMQENGQTCNVGSGFSDQERNDIWESRETMYNRIVEIKYQDLSNDGVMRFPIFLRYRCDGDGVKK